MYLAQRAKEMNILHLWAIWEVSKVPHQAAYDSSHLEMRGKHSLYYTATGANLSTTNLASKGEKGVRVAP